jgi:Endoplasmic reticulum-based factor for assembly of V-ATPase
MMAPNGASKKVLEGVKATPKLRSLLRGCIAKPTTTSQDRLYNEVLASAVTRAKASLPISQAQALLTIHSNDEMVSIDVIRAMYSVLQSDKQTMKKLDDALANTRLMYTPPPTQEKETDEQRRFRKRMDRLRLREEEARYKKLTQNLDTYVEDDVTTKSMTYAASIGLNMIVAPLSFGVFMYFFAGAIFGWMLQEEVNPHKTDIKRVITGESLYAWSAPHSLDRNTTN